MHRSVRSVFAVVLGLVISAAALAAEKSIKETKLPDAVRKTAAQEATGQTVTGYTKDTVEGVTTYGVDFLVDGNPRTVVIDKQGMVVAVENEIAWDALPADVQKDFTAVIGTSKLGKVTSVSRGGDVVSYSASFDRDGRTQHVNIKPNPKPATP